MRLRWLCKSEDSVPQGQCPAMYIADDPAVMVSQGKVLDEATTSEMRDLADDERGVAIPTETVLRAAALVLSENGRPSMLAEVEAFLAEQRGSGR